MSKLDSTMHIQPIFSSFFFHNKNINLNHDLILKDLKKLKYGDTNDAYHHMSENKNLFNVLKEGEKIKEVFSQYINQAIESLGYNAGHQIVNCWANKVLAKHDAGFHMHKNFWLSCVYYPHGTLKDEYRLIFKSDRLNDYTGFDIPVNSFNIFNSHTFTVKVEKGDFIIFPSLLEHKADIHFSKNTRYSIAANIFPLGIIGYGEGHLQLNNIL